jgi:hypothetical protein
MKKTNEDYRYIYSSLTRISDLDKGFHYKRIRRKNWESGDYVVCEVLEIGGSASRVELVSGRMMQLMRGDIIVGALGERHATLEATGSYKAVRSNLKMNLLTGAGLMGRLTSRSVFITPLIELQYRGHVFRGKVKKRMFDYSRKVSLVPFNMPVILLVGTSMSAGKTTSARIVTRQLKRLGLHVVGAKLSGAGRYRDILSVKDAGADQVFDFVDVGLPSSICSRKTYEKVLHQLLSLIMNTKADIAVFEIGASPLEPYNGDLAIEAIKNHVKCTILCASDPYAVLGVMKSFDLKPSIVSGPAANTLGGAELIEKLSGIRALNLFEQNNLPALQKILKTRLELK